MAVIAGNAPYVRDLTELVGLDTVSPMSGDQEYRLARCLATHGCEPVAEHLFGRGLPQSQVWLYVHADTKPAGRLSEWTSDPWQLTELGERWYGLGASDAKSQVLNALEVSRERRVFVLIDTSEECDGAAARAFVRRHRIGALVVIDGASDSCDFHDGLSGQIDGTLVLSSGQPRQHPARAAEDYFRTALGGFLDAVQHARFRFRITGITTEESERSLTVESARVRFDIRFAAEHYAEVEAFLGDHHAEVRQRLAPAYGRRRIRKAWGVCPQAAPFSCRLGAEDATADVVIAAPGGHGEDRAHQPNESISLANVLRHQERLHRLLQRLETTDG